MDVSVKYTWDLKDLQQRKERIKNIFYFHTDYMLK